MSVEKYIQSLGSGQEADSGEFTLSPQRAKDLLSEAALADHWDAWLCVLQGFYAFGSTRVNIELQRASICFQVELPQRFELPELAKQPRFLLGWLNLSHFGQVHWSGEKSELTVEFSGSIFKRYFMAKSLRRIFLSKLRFAHCPTRLDNRLVSQQGFVPTAHSYTVFSRADCQAWSLPCSSVLNLSDDRLRRVWMSPEQQDSKALVASLACKTSSSWSEVQWVSRGVIVCEERNTLERPGLHVVASVEALGLKTDLSGFSIVHDHNYLDFINRLKREVLWML